MTMGRRVERRRTPRRSNDLVIELIDRRDALREKVSTANARLAQAPDADLVEIREMLSAAEVELHAFGAKTLEWAHAVQLEMSALRRN
jgi:hypothetical protein